MWLETSRVPCAASCALRVMSCVALRCWAVSTSMPDMIDEISDNVLEMPSIAPRVSAVMPWMLATCEVISSVALLV